MLQDYQLLQSLLYICGSMAYPMMITELTTITSALQQQVSWLMILEDIILLCECNGVHIYKGLTYFKSKWHNLCINDMT